MNLRRLFFCFLIVMFAAPQPEASAETVKISYSSVDMAFLLGAVAEKRGFFKEEGLDVELIRARADLSVTALVTGDLDYTLIFGSVIQGAVKGLPLKVVMVSLNRPLHFVIAKPEISTMKDLRGKTIAISSFGATAERLTRIMLKREGLDPEKDVKLVAMGEPKARLATLQQGLVDATVASPPGHIEAEKLGFKILANAAETLELPFTGLGTSERKVKENPAQVKKAIKALIKAGRFAREDREGTIKIIMDWMKLERKVAASSYEAFRPAVSLNGGTTPEALRLALELADKAEPVALEKVADFKLLHEVQQELKLR
jgi:NitT/TauT family transport system substrate-binding protein